MSAVRPCPAGHLSTEPDYCSSCGAPMGTSPSPPLAPVSPPPARVRQPRAACPLCATPLAPEDRTCPLCCYELDLPPLPPLRRAPDPSATTWYVIIRVDPALDNDPDPAFPCPINTPEIKYEIKEEVTLSRGNLTPWPPLPAEQKGEREQGRLLLEDPGVSRRHAVLQRAEDGLWLVDLGSTNGTRCNGAVLEAHVQVPLRPGDEVTLGRWTRLVVRRW
jgi:hypothetical protein